MERVLDDLAQHVRDGLLDLFVDSRLHVVLRVRNVVLLLLFLVEPLAIAVLSQVQEILGTYRVAFAGVDWVVTFNACVLSCTIAFVAEARGITEALFLAIKL